MDLRARVEELEHRLAAAEANQEVLLQELQNRVRKILAQVRTLVRRTTEGIEDAEEIAERLDGRIDALARTQGLLVDGPGGGLELEVLVREELLAQGSDDGRTVVEGPHVLLSQKAAELLALALHELATNATRYGAIGGEGELSITWRIAPQAEGPAWLNFDWVEQGVSVVAAAPRQPGFGTELVERRVPYELNGRGKIEMRPGGLTAEIAFPLVSGESPRGAGASSAAARAGDDDGP